AAGVGGGERVATTAAVAGEDLGAGATGDFRRGRAGHTGVLADIGGDVVRVRAFGDVGGHRGRRVAVRGPRVVDLVLDDAFDRGVVEAADFARRREGVVEVRPDRRRGAGLGKRVADAALRGEEDATARDVRARRAAPRDHEDRGEQRSERGEEADGLGEVLHTVEARRSLYVRAPVRTLDAADLPGAFAPIRTIWEADPTGHGE